ncbi:MAG TPA: FtsQ-type POTRA domain-containing protein [Kineosporiaceae bacterium]|nr:FtsQ-type POTRA domain-containing protein [Kineosporiaceae bacterium]
MSPRAAGRQVRRPGRPGTTGTAAGGSTVSSASARRFAARVRRRRLRRIGLILLVVALIGGIAGAALYSPWTTVRQIRISGTSRVPTAQVQELLADQYGCPLLLVDTGRLEARVSGLRLVSGVSVRRTWPGTLTVTVRERVPVAAVPASAGVRLVDRDGVEVATAARPPAGMPLVQVDLTKTERGSLAATLDVLAALPAPLAKEVTAIGADSPDGVWLALADGSRVLWGSAAGSADKVVVLARLRAAADGRARRFDVSAPQAPAVSALP